MDGEQFQDLAMAGEAPLSAELVDAPERKAFLKRARAFERPARLTVRRSPRDFLGRPSSLSSACMLPCRSLRC